MSRIFVSHGSKDQESAKLLGDWLQEQGHTSFFLDFDPDKGVAAGKPWENELYRHLRLCRAVIALPSPNWLESRWFFAEVTQARGVGKPTATKSRPHFLSHSGIDTEANWVLKDHG